MEMETFPLKYLRSAEMLGKSARFDVWQSYQHARWNGTLDGVPASTSRSGWSDISLQLAVNVIGSPPVEREEFAQYGAANPVETIVGLAKVVQITTGQYINDKLLNLGSNRYTFRPQVGVLHNRKKMTSETIWVGKPVWAILFLSASESSWPTSAPARKYRSERTPTVLRWRCRSFGSAAV